VEQKVPGLSALDREVQRGEETADASRQIVTQSTGEAGGSQSAKGSEGRKNIQERRKKTIATLSPPKEWEKRKSTELGNWGIQTMKTQKRRQGVVSATKAR